MALQRCLSSLFVSIHTWTPSQEYCFCKASFGWISYPSQIQQVQCKVPLLTVPWILLCHQLIVEWCCARQSVGGTTKALSSVGCECTFKDVELGRVPVHAWAERGSAFAHGVVNIVETLRVGWGMGKVKSVGWQMLQAELRPGKVCIQGSGAERVDATPS